MILWDLFDPVGSRASLIRELSVILLWPCQEQMLRGLSGANYTWPGKNEAREERIFLVSFALFYKWDNWEKGNLGETLVAPVGASSFGSLWELVQSLQGWGFLTSPGLHTLIIPPLSPTC